MEAWFQIGYRVHKILEGEKLKKFQVKLTKISPNRQNSIQSNSNDAYPSQMAINGYIYLKQTWWHGFREKFRCLVIVGKVKIRDGIAEKLTEITKISPLINQMMPMHIRWLWIATHTKNKHRQRFQTSFKVTTVLSVEEIGNILVRFRIVKKLTKIPPQVPQIMPIHT